MRKFKHKITGRIAEQRIVAGILDVNNYDVEKFSGCLPKEFIENSNDWQEIIEKKDYEILSFKTNCGTIEYIGKNDDINGWLNAYNCKIHSIKRLSDGEVFTVGDRVCGEILNNEIINSITIKNNLLKFNISQTGLQFIHLNKIQHVKQPLFTTVFNKEQQEAILEIIDNKLKNIQ